MKTFLIRGGALGLVLLFFAGFALFAALGQSTQVQGFDAGSTLQARVAHLAETGTTSTNVTTRRDYRVTVQAEGNRFTGSVSRGMFEGLSVGDTITVRRIPGSPGRYELEAGALEASSWAALIMAVVAGAGGLFLIWLGIRTARATPSA